MIELAFISRDFLFATNFCSVSHSTTKQNKTKQNKTKQNKNVSRNPAGVF
jgi:hypothetical protein